VGYTPPDCSALYHASFIRHVKYVIIPLRGSYVLSKYS
jgi:hypothetical protein